MRGKQAPRREMIPDHKFGNVVVTKMINYVMKSGKKSTAERVVYDCFAIIEAEAKENPMDVFGRALTNVTPTVEVKSKRVGGANYQVPMPVRGDRRNALAFRWLLGAARSKKGRPMSEKLAEELMSAAKGEGEAVRKKNDVQRMAEANRAFAHLAR